MTPIGSSPEPWPSTLAVKILLPRKGPSRPIGPTGRPLISPPREPGQDWTGEIARDATGAEQHSLLETLRKLVARGYHGLQGQAEIAVGHATNNGRNYPNLTSSHECAAGRRGDHGLRGQDCNRLAGFERHVSKGPRRCGVVLSSSIHRAHRAADGWAMGRCVHDGRLVPDLLKQLILTISAGVIGAAISNVAISPGGTGVGCDKSGCIAGASSAGSLEPFRRRQRPRRRRRGRPPRMLARLRSTTHVLGRR